MAIPIIDDSSLVNSYIAGNETALELLIKRHQSKIFSFIYSKLGDKDLANDIFQDTFIKVIRTLKTNSYKEEGKFLPWVIRIAHNLIMDHFRDRKKILLTLDTEQFSVFSMMIDNTLSIENKLISDQVAKDLNLLIEELPSDQKEVILMRLFHEMSFKEISETTGVSINTALGRMRYALINLRKVINKNHIILTN